MTAMSLDDVSSGSMIGSCGLQQDGFPAALEEQRWDTRIMIDRAKADPLGCGRQGCRVHCAFFGKGRLPAAAQCLVELHEIG